MGSNAYNTNTRSYLRCLLVHGQWWPGPSWSDWRLACPSVETKFRDQTQNQLSPQLSLISRQNTKDYLFKIRCFVSVNIFAWTSFTTFETTWQSKHKLVKKDKLLQVKWRSYKWLLEFKRGLLQHESYWKCSQMTTEGMTCLRATLLYFLFILPKQAQTYHIPPPNCSPTATQKHNSLVHKHKNFVTEIFESNTPEKMLFPVHIDADHPVLHFLWTVSRGVKGHRTRDGQINFQLLHLLHHLYLGSNNILFTSETIRRDIFFFYGDKCSCNSTNAMSSRSLLLIHFLVNLFHHL